MARSALYLITLSLTLAAGCAGHRAATHSPARLAGQEVLTDLSGLERRVLADRHVTRAEYAEANAVTGACLRTNGLTVVAFTDDDILAGATVTSDGGDSRGLVGGMIDPAVREQQCRDGTDAVAAVWVLQNAPSPEQRLAAYQAFTRCLVDAGIDMPTSPAIEDMLSAAIDVLARTDPADAQVNRVRTCVRDVLPAVTMPLPGLAEALNALPTGRP